MLCVVVWVLAFLAHLLERDAGRTASRGRTTSARVAGDGDRRLRARRARGSSSGVLGVPRRYAVQPPGTSGYSLAGEHLRDDLRARLPRPALGSSPGSRGRRAPRRYEVVEIADTWSGSRWRVRRRPTSRTRRSGPCPAWRSRSASSSQDRRSSGSPSARPSSRSPRSSRRSCDASETSTGYHHLDHAGQFLFGALVGAIVGSLPRVAGRLDHRTADLGSRQSSPRPPR